MQTVCAQGSGQKTAVSGTLSEYFIAKALTECARLPNVYDAIQTTTDQIGFNNDNKFLRHALSVLGEDEYLNIWYDAVHAIITIHNFLSTNYGAIIKARPVGFDIHNGFQKVSGGKKSSGDVFLDTDKMPLGLSLKYSTAINKGHLIKVYAPTPNTFCKILDKHYFEIMGKDYGLFALSKIIKREAKEAEKLLCHSYPGFLSETFGINVPFRTTKDKNAYYRPDAKLVILNAVAHSHLRRLRDAGLQIAVEFQKHISTISIKEKHQYAEHFYVVMSAIINNGSKKQVDDFFRTITNIAADHIKTLIVNTKRSKETTTEIYCLAESLNHILAQTTQHTLEKNDPSTSFLFGRLTINVDSRPGTKMGAIGIKIDKRDLKLLNGAMNEV